MSTPEERITELGIILPGGAEAALGVPRVRPQRQSHLRLRPDRQRRRPHPLPGQARPRSRCRDRRRSRARLRDQCARNHPPGTRFARQRRAGREEHRLRCVGRGLRRAAHRRQRRVRTAARHLRRNRSRRSLRHRYGRTPRWAPASKQNSSSKPGPSLTNTTVGGAVAWTSVRRVIRARTEACHVHADNERGAHWTPLSTLPLL